MAVLLLCAGFISLYFGAEWLVRGSVGLGLRAGISPLIAGLTIVSIGTSAPELVVSLVAALNGQSEIALGNVIGSNIFNIGLILGVTAVLTPLRVRSQLVKLDIPILIGLTAFFLWMFRDFTVSRGDAVGFTLLMAGYLAVNVWTVRRDRTAPLTREFEDEIEPPTGSAAKDVMLVVLGLALLAAGSRFFVDGAASIARTLGVSEAVIGLTVVAAGTSLPELAASLAAAMRRHADVAVGNVVGSCIFNLVGILGLTGLAAGPLVATGISVIDLGLMTVLTLLLILFGRTGFTLKRWEGLVLLFIFAGYQIWLWPK